MGRRTGDASVAPTHPENAPVGARLASPSSLLDDGRRKRRPYSAPSSVSGEWARGEPEGAPPHRPPPLGIGRMGEGDAGVPPTRWTPTSNGPRNSPTSVKSPCAAARTFLTG